MARLKRFFGSAASFFGQGLLASTPLGQVYSAFRLRSAVTEFRINPNVRTSFNVGNLLIGVVGTERFLTFLFRYVLKLGIKASLADKQIGEEMVDHMKANVPQDTGRLLNGIKVEYDNDLVTVSASGVHDEGGEDYAMFVEFGTGDNGKVADDSFFENGTDAGVVFHARGERHHASTPAEPFFWDAAREGLAKHHQILDDAINTSGEGE